MKSQQDTRIILLEMTAPKDLSNPDVGKWIDRARQLEAFVNEGSGQGATPPKRSPGRPRKSELA